MMMSNNPLLNTERTIKTFLGKYIDVFDPNLEDIQIEDIAHALAHTPRWGGHTEMFYSVGLHSVWVCNNVPLEYRLEALLHDATEAYIGDMPKPIKRHLPDFNKLESILDSAIRKKFGIQVRMSKEVKTADRLALEWEWDNIKECNNILHEPPTIVKSRFIELFTKYSKINQNGKKL